jgi:hypothetical protein
VSNDNESQPNAREVEAQVRATYRDLASQQRLDIVSLAALRKALPQDLPREAVDAALLNVARHDDVHITPRSDQKNASPEDQDAALYFGGQHNHQMHIEATRDLSSTHQRIESTDRETAASMLAPMDDTFVAGLAQRMGVEAGDDPQETRQRIADKSQANLDHWTAEASQERLDGLLLAEADKAPVWAANMDPQTRQEVHDAAQRRIDAGRWDDYPGLIERARRWRDFTGSYCEQLAAVGPTKTDQRTDEDTDGA